MKISLTGQDAQYRSVLASTQRYVNVYSEASLPHIGEPGETTWLPTPGTTLLGATPDNAVIRGLYRASNGDLYAATPTTLYWIDSSWVFHSIGTIGVSTSVSPVRFADNGTSLILCDGTTNGWSVNLATHGSLATLQDVEDPDGLGSGWQGANFVAYSDTYFIANSPGTPIFYVSDSEATTFSTNQFASKVGYSDTLAGIAVAHRVVWLIGTVSTEVWYNTGGDGTITNSFPYSIMPGVQIDWGCAAPNSICKADNCVFWLGQNNSGQAAVIMGQGYQTTRISNHALEEQIRGYPRIDDCRAYTYLQDGHHFVVFNFPSADATIVYDVSSQNWHERCWLDPNGMERRHRGEWGAFAYGKNVVSDWQNGNIYALDLDSYTDNGQPIKRLISFPRMIDSHNDRRISFRSAIFEIDTGESLVPADNPMLNLEFSDDKGRTWSTPIQQPLGKTGQFNTTVKFNRLGLSRNRVFRLTWAANCMTALQAAFIDVELSRS